MKFILLFSSLVLNVVQVLGELHPKVGAPNLCYQQGTVCTVMSLIRYYDDTVIERDDIETLIISEEGEIKCRDLNRQDCSITIRLTKKGV